MNKLLIVLISVLIVSGCSDRQELNNQQAIQNLQTEVDNLKKQVATLNTDNVPENKPLIVDLPPQTFKSRLDEALYSVTFERGIDRVILAVMKNRG